MEKYIDVVASTFYLVSVNKGWNRANFGKDCIPPNGNKIKYEDIEIDLDNVSLEYYKQIFKPLSLTQLRDLLYLLVPFSTNWMCGANYCYVNTLPHVKMAIKYIETDLFIVMKNDGVRNNK
jgi:hypothetical protein